MTELTTKLSRAEAIQACLDLAKYHASRHDQRRSYEWKVSLGFWGLIVAGIAGNLSLPPGTGWGALALYAALWLRSVWLANDHDKSLADHFRCQGEKLLCFHEHQAEHIQGKRRSLCELRWWVGFLSSPFMWLTLPRFDVHHFPMPS